MLSRRNLLLGAASLPLATPAIPARASSGLAADLVTMLDDSASMYAPQDRENLALGNIRSPHLHAWATAMESFPTILANSRFAYLDFTVTAWADETRPIIPRTRIHAANAVATCATIASLLLADANRPTYLGRGQTDVSLALGTGLGHLKGSTASHKVINIVTDDQPTRLNALAYHPYHKVAMAQAVVINALILGNPDGLHGYFHKLATGQVLTGTGPEVWRRKFTLDLS